MKAKKQIDRRAIIISAMLTALFLSGAAALGLAARATSAPATSDMPAVLDAGQPTSDVGNVAPPIVVTVEPFFVAAGQAAQPTLASGQPAPQTATSDAVITAYQAQLTEAYRALQEAYAQIETLQAAQAQTAASPAYRNGDDDHEHDGNRHEEHDEHGEKEHDDD